MPKFTKRNRPPRSKVSTMAVGAGAGPGTPDDVASLDDGVSVCSNVSSATDIYDDAETATTDMLLSTDNLDEKFDGAIEALRNKDLKTRETGLKSLQTIFCQKVIPDLIATRRETIIESLLSCLKKSTDVSESKLAPIIAALFVIQLGEQNDELYSRFRDAIVPTLRDETKLSSIRASCAQAIGIISFIASEEISSTLELMKLLESIFARSYLASDGTSPVVSKELQELHTAALSSWCLLVSSMPAVQAHELIREYAPVKVPGLIESSDVDLRNEAGETIAVLYEIAREINSIFAQPDDYLLERLQEKANESAKYKGKKEKRLQRATFREIYNSFIEGTSPEFDIKFGRETLEIQSWTSRLYYTAFSRVLGTGMNVHLKDNPLLRSIFSLDAREADDIPQPKGNRFERQQANKAAFKHRTQALKKTRDNKNVHASHVDD